MLKSLEQPLHSHDYIVICYNSRGVGRSTGWSSFTGLSEAKDLEDLVQWGLETYPNVRSVLIVVRRSTSTSFQVPIVLYKGYSHGSLIASLQSILPAPVKTSHILISYPLGTRGLLTLFRSSTYASALRSLIQSPTGNVLVIYGDKDEFTSGSKYDIWSEELQNDAKGDGKGRLKVVKVAGGSHFWRVIDGKEMTDAVGQWLLGG